VTVLGKLFTRVPLSPSTIIWHWTSGGQPAIARGRHS